MTTRQQQALTKLRMAFFGRVCTGNPANHEFKKDEVTVLEGCSSVFVVLQVGMVKDEDTAAQVYCRTHGHFQIGVRGGVKVLSLSSGLRDVPREYQRQYVGGR